MAIPWLTVLQAIPWGQVIENTPKLVDGAQKLFSRLKKDKVPDNIEPEIPGHADEMTRLQCIEKHVQENRHELQTLHQDLRDTADLLHHITEQNAKMVSEIETLRRRMRRWQCLTIIAALLSLSALGRLWFL